MSLSQPGNSTFVSRDCIINDDSWSTVVMFSFTTLSANNIFHIKQSGAVEACWAHNPEVRGSKPRSAKYFFYSRGHVCVRQELGLLPVLPGEEEEGGVDDVRRVRQEILVEEQFIFSSFWNSFLLKPRQRWSWKQDQWPYSFMDQTRLTMFSVFPIKRQL